MYNGLPAPFEVDQNGDGKFVIRFGAPYDGAMAYLIVLYTFSDLEHSQFSDVPYNGVNFFLEMGSSGYSANYYHLTSSLIFASCLGAILVSMFYIRGILVQTCRYRKDHDKPT